MLVGKGRLRKMCAHCSVGRGLCEKRTQSRLRFSVVFLLEFSLIMVSYIHLEAHFQILWECAIAFSRRKHSYKVLEENGYTEFGDQTGCIWGNWTMLL